MGLIIFVVVISLVSLVACVLFTGIKESVDSEPKHQWTSDKDLHKRFKDAYLWACEVFGVRENVYDELEYNIGRYPSLGLHHFTFYYVSRYSFNYPRMQQCKKVLSTWASVDEMEDFAEEFINLVNGMRNNVDSEDLSLFNRYHIPIKKLLTTEFEIDNMKLYSLPS